MKIVELIDQKEIKEVKNLKQGNSQVIKHLNDIGKKYAELVNENLLQLTNRILQDQIEVLTYLIKNNSWITQKYIKATLYPIERGIEELNFKIDLLLSKEKRFMIYKNYVIQSIVNYFQFLCVLLGLWLNTTKNYDAHN